jgi:hypothetical protein
MTENGNGYRGDIENTPKFRGAIWKELMDGKLRQIRIEAALEGQKRWVETNFWYIRIGLGALYIVVGALFTYLFMS